MESGATDFHETVGPSGTLVVRADFEASVELTEPFPERWTDYLIEIVGDYVF